MEKGADRSAVNLESAVALDIVGWTAIQYGLFGLYAIIPPIVRKGIASVRWIPT
jgi:hypothetical protein